VVRANDTKGDGGGLSNGGNLTILNSTFISNSASGQGGGIYHGPGQLTIFTTTIALNDAGGGGGIAVVSPTVAASLVISGNYAKNGGGLSVGGLIFMSNSTV